MPRRTDRARIAIPDSLAYPQNGSSRKWGLEDKRPCPVRQHGASSTTTVSGDSGIGRMDKNAYDMSGTGIASRA